MKRTAITMATLALLVTSAYAATVNNPGTISFTPNGDSHWQVGSGNGNELATTTFLIEGSVDGNGDTSFESFDFGFEVVEDGNGYATQLQLLSDGTGTFCPNSGEATITITARIKITKYAGNSIASTPCYLLIDSGDPFTLTTDQSGNFVGERLTEPNPKFVAEVTFAQASGVQCPTTAASYINAYYDLISGPMVGHIELDDANLGQLFTGDGC